MKSYRLILLGCALLPIMHIAGCSGTSEDINVKPSFITGAAQKITYDGVTDDLLTAGLGKTGLQGAAPGFADPLNPTAAELRKRVIYYNYRAVLDITSNGGYGTLYGPNIDINGNSTLGEGKIAGEEYIAYADDGTGKQNVTLMVQIPASFDTNNPCIITAPASGSRGIYGAIGASGEWGLKHACVVAYTDKGTGNGAHDLQANTVNLITGVRQDAATAGNGSNFTANLTTIERSLFTALLPNRIAFKHAHSQQNPEKDWGKNVLQSVEYAFYLLNEKYGALAADGVRRLKTFTPANTITIASGISNGGGASIAAAELDTQGLIRGVAVAEPNTQLSSGSIPVINRGGTSVANAGKGLMDYFSYANIYQPCAAYATANAASPYLVFVNAARAANRCDALSSKGLLSAASGDLPAQTAEAQAKLNAYAWENETNLLQASHYAFATPAIAVTYTNTYGKFSVAESICGFSFGATDAVTGAPAAVSAANIAKIFGDGNGIPPTGGISVINNLSSGGAVLDGLSVTPSTGKQDYNLEGALCIRSLLTGKDPVTGSALTRAMLANSLKVQEGVAAVVRNGNLKGKPAIIVQGRSDTLLPVNHTGRPYFGLNKKVEGATGKLSYIEVTNAQHFDSFLAFPGYDTRLVPLHKYLIEALDKVYDNLKKGTALPASQVVRTTPRGGTAGAAPAISTTNVPAIAASPAVGDQITFSGSTVSVPD